MNFKDLLIKIIILILALNYFPNWVIVILFIISFLDKIED